MLGKGFDDAPILVTGAAGFIGAHLTKHLLLGGRKVIGVDNLNAYYDPRLKSARLKHLCGSVNFDLRIIDIANRLEVKTLFEATQFDTVIHLAAQAGVRYSLSNPEEYIDSNLVGFANVLEGVRHQQCRHFIFASSSSVYGSNSKVPFEEQDRTDSPVSLYAATKKSNELMAHSYSHLFNLPTTALRFFTVYGPWGRPDMALFKFVEAIANGDPITLYNHGRMRRDFTFIDDIVDSVVRLIEVRPQKSTSPDQWSSAPYRVYNIGNSAPVDLISLVRAIEKALGRPANVKLMPMEAGDVFETFASVEALSELIGAVPHTSIESGVKKFVSWYLEEYSKVMLDESPAAACRR